MTKATPEAAARPFRPVSAGDFNAYAKSLSSLINEPYQQCLEALARIYGYSGRHEVQAVLAESAPAGVFEDELPYAMYGEPGDFRAERAERISRVLSEMKGTAATPIQVERLRLAEHLGLFARPTEHRRRVRVVKAALPLVEEGWGAVTAVRLIDQYSPDAFFKATFKLDTQRLENFDLKVTPLPEAMEAMRRYRAPELYLLEQDVDEETATGFQEQDLAFDGSFLDCDTGEFIAAASEQFDWVQYVVEVLYPKHTGKAVDERLLEDDELIEAIYRFCDEPAPDVAKHHPVLAAIPDVCAIAQAWLSFCRARAAHAFVDQRKPRALLFHETRLGDDANAQTDCFCTVSLSEGHDSSEFEDMMLWDYEATIWLESAGEGPWIPAAVMNGILIDPYRNEYRVSPDNFKWQMDAHSQFLNDVWKVLQFEYFQRNGYDSIHGYLTEHPWRSFATINIELAPEFRGRGLLASFVQTFVDTMSESFNQFDLQWKDLHNDGGAGDYEPEFHINTPGVLVFPVEGSRPASNMVPWENILLVDSPRKVPQKDIAVNPAVEATRHKLEAQFKSLSGRVSIDDGLGEDDDGHVEILVYNPWDYPNT